jgi:hypothetical protein
MESRFWVVVFYLEKATLPLDRLAGIMLGFNCRSLKLGDFEALIAALKAFRDKRNWQQFHTLRNLITSLNVCCQGIGLRQNRGMKPRCVPMLKAGFNTTEQLRVVAPHH